MSGSGRDPSDINDGPPLAERDPWPDRLLDIAEQALDKGLAREAFEAVNTVVNPPPPPNPNRSLGREPPVPRR